MWGIFILQTMNYLLSNSKLEEGKKKKKRGILSFLTKRLTHLGIVTNIFLSPFLFTEVLLQASQYTHKFTHSASKYHLPLSLSLMLTHLPLSLYLFLYILLFQLNLYPCAYQILSLSKPNKVQAFHQFHIQSQTTFYYIQLKNQN